MAYRLNPLVETVAAAPIAEAQGWVRGRRFPADRPLLDCAQAVPSYPPAEELTRHLAEAVQRPETAFYTDILGREDLRAALAAHLSIAYEGAVSADQIGITAGCNQAFCLAATSIAGAGEEVILPLPYYFNYQMWLEMLGVSVVPLAVGEDDALPDPDAAARLITSGTRAIGLISPNNPTGATYPAELIEAFYRLAQRHGIALVLDETYKDFRLDRGPAHRLFQDPDWPGTLVQLYSFSKAYSLTGYRVGALAAGKPLLEALAKAMDCVAICAPNIGQEAALFGIEHLAEWREAKRRLMLGRLDALRSAFQANALRYRLISAGAFFAWVRHPFVGEPAATVARRLADRQNLLCLPGTIFGPGQEGVLRLAFANLPAEAMAEVVGRLMASQDDLHD
ncbi:MAG TPA: aminotransferase [Alphaproteobacteria bacterium]|nr:aminotransferase [Alphaproteobacteria bacterium]